MGSDVEFALISKLFGPIAELHQYRRSLLFAEKARRDRRSPRSALPRLDF